MARLKQFDYASGHTLRHVETRGCSAVVKPADNEWLRCRYALVKAERKHNGAMV
jgi:hypothetical protein